MDNRLWLILDELSQEYKSSNQIGEDYNLSQSSLVHGSLL